MINYFAGHIILETELPLQEVGTILAAKLFAEIPFIACDIGRSEGVHTLQLSNEMLGCIVLLQEALENNGKKQVVLKINPSRNLISKMPEKQQQNIDVYLRFWAKEQLKDVAEITVTDLR